MFSDTGIADHIRFLHYVYDNTACRGASAGPGEQKIAFCYNPDYVCRTGDFVHAAGRLCGVIAAVLAYSGVFRFRRRLYRKARYNQPFFLPKHPHLGNHWLRSGAQICGIVYEKISPGSVYILFAICILFAAMGIVGSGRPEEKTETSERKSGDKGSRGGILRNGLFWEYMVISALFHTTTSLNSTYLPALYQAAGVSVSATSTVLFIGTLMELPVIFFASLYMNRISNRRLLQMMFVILILQFGAYALIPVLPVKIAATVLLKSSVTMAYIMINLKVISSLVPEEYQMTALTTVSSFKNLATVLMQVAGGHILDTFSVYTLFLILTLAAALGLLLSFVFRIPTKEENAPKF